MRSRIKFGMTFCVWDDIGELGMIHVVVDDTEGCCDCGTKSTRKIIILKIFCFFLIFFCRKIIFLRIYILEINKKSEVYVKSVMASNELSFTDECVFQKVMKDEKICKGVVETILGKKIAKLEYLTDPEEFVFFPEQRHIKLEVLFEGTDKSVNVELKNINHEDFALLSRSYQSVTDYEALLSGVHFTEFKENYLIFICRFDPFGKGLPVYTFENMSLALNPAIWLNDGIKKIFLNTTAKDLSSLNPELKALYCYINNKCAESELTQAINEKVLSINMG